MLRLLAGPEVGPLRCIATLHLPCYLVRSRAMVLGARGWQHCLQELKLCAPVPLLADGPCSPGTTPARPQSPVMAKREIHLKSGTAHTLCQKQ